MGMPRKRKFPRWTSEMVEIPEARLPRDPPEKRDCCKPKPKLSPLRVASAQQTVIEETTAAADGTTVDRISVSVTCEFADDEATLIEEGLLEEIPVEDTTADEPAPKKTKLSHEPEMERSFGGKSLDFKDIWGSAKQPVSPNSRRNKDMLWSLVW